MDLPADDPEARAFISAEPLVTPAGQQIDQVTGANAAPGTKKVFFGAIYAGGEPGSTVSWQVGSMSNAVSSETFTFEIPAIDAFQPLTFN
jgi:hypothetical protein